MSAVRFPLANASPEFREGSAGMTLHLADYDVEFPFGRLTFEEFRHWTLSDNFPERGRFDFLDGRIEADMSPESLYSHNKPKGRIYSVLDRRAEEDELGDVFGDRARVLVETVGLSCEPDLTFIANQSLESGCVTLTPRDDRPDDAVEIVGPPDLVVEVVSNSSARKDNHDLYALYFEAGIREYWIIDVRGAQAVFRLLIRSESGWSETAPDQDGFRFSQVFGHHYRLDRRRGRRGEWRYDLLERKPG